MKKFWLILGLLMVVALTVEEVYDFFVTNQGVEYFGSRPYRLLCVAGIAVAGGVVAFAYGRLSVERQRSARLAVLAAVASGVSAFFCFMCVAAFRVLSEPLLASPRGLMIVCAGVFLVAALWLWFEFWHLLRRGATKFL